MTYWDRPEVVQLRITAKEIAQGYPDGALPDAVDDLVDQLHQQYPAVLAAAGIRYVRRNSMSVSDIILRNDASYRVLKVLGITLSEPAWLKGCRPKVTKVTPPAQPQSPR